MKDPFDIFIDEAVELTRQEYYKLLFKTKRLFFKCLLENKPLEYFNDKVSKIWDNVDHSFMKKQIEKLGDMITAYNTKGHQILNPEAKFEQIFKLEPESRFFEIEKKYNDFVKGYFSGKQETLKLGVIDKDEYIVKSIKAFNKAQEIVPYYNKDGTIRCYHNVASYLSMVQNTNLLKSGWNRTMYDSQLLENDLAYLPAHPGACPLCMYAQGRIYSISGNDTRYPAKEQAMDGTFGMIGHPNCKHSWLLYWSDRQLQREKYDGVEWEEYYQNQQKARALERRIAVLKNDKTIYKKIENYNEIDKINKNIQKYKGEIQTLKEKNQNIIGSR